jgi:hypothetical protein
MSSSQLILAQLVRDGYAPKTIDQIHDVLRTAVKWGHLTDNPHNVDLPTLRTVRPKWALSETQAAALLEKLPLLAKTMAMLASGTDDLVFATWSGNRTRPIACSGRRSFQHARAWDLARHVAQV